MAIVYPLHICPSPYFVPWLQKEAWGQQKLGWLNPGVTVQPGASVHRDRHRWAKWSHFPVAGMKWHGSNFLHVTVLPPACSFSLGIDSSATALVVSGEKNWKSKVWTAQVLWAGTMSCSAWWTCVRPLFLWLSGLIWIWINLETQERATKLKLGHKGQAENMNQTSWSRTVIYWPTITVGLHYVVITIIMRWWLTNSNESCSFPWTQGMGWFNENTFHFIC